MPRVGLPHRFNPTPKKVSPQPQRHCQLLARPVVRLSQNFQEKGGEAVDSKPTIGGAAVLKKKLLYYTSGSNRDFRISLLT